MPVEYQGADGSIAGDLVRVLDYDDPENNEFLAVNQFTVVEDGHERRADVVFTTVQARRTAAKSFTRWLVKHGKLVADPLAAVAEPGPAKDRRHERRMLLHEE